MKRDIDKRGISLAELSARITRLLKRDTYSAALPIELVECGVGHAVLGMNLDAATLNAHGTGHGGAIWTLADMAFGAAGQYDSHILTTGSDLSFLRPAMAGGRLLAEAREIARKGRFGHFQITIRTEGRPANEVIALGRFTGQWVGAQESEIPQAGG